MSDEQQDETTQTNSLVKPLEWVAWVDGFQAHTPFGSYTVEPPDHEIGRRSHTWRYCFDEYYDEDTTTCDTIEDGKAAAQAHWNDRVSGICVTPPGGPFTMVPTEIWETAFACFAARVGVEMQDRETMPEIWAEVFRFACDDDALKRLGIPATLHGEQG